MILVIGRKKPRLFPLSPDEVRAQGLICRRLARYYDDHEEESAAGPIGWTATLQVQPTRPVYIGLRVDNMDEDWQYAAYLSYYTSEFLRLRAGAATDLDTWIADAQLTFVWGSHPVEPYWVNR